MSPDKTPVRPIAIYCRVSRTGDRDVEAEGGSAEQQEARCRAQLEAKGYPVGPVFTDLDESGGKESRPAFDKLMEGIEDGRFGGMIMLNLSRFGRHRGVPKLIEDLESKYGATLLAVEDNLDTSTPSGRFAVTILSAVNSLYLDQMTEGWKRSRKTAVSLGRYAAPTPFGYKRNDEKKLVPDPVTAPFVVEAFARKARGETLVDIARWFNEAGAPKKQRFVRRVTPNTPEGLKVGDPLPITPWLDREIADILKREVYLGVSQTSDGGRNDEAHEAIVDRETWLRAQAARSTGQFSRNAKTDDHPFKGKVFCAACGHSMSRKVNKALRNHVQIHWRCQNSACPSRAGISAKRLEPWLCDRLAEEAVVLLGDPASSNEQRLAQARAKLDAAELELGTFLTVARATDPGYAEAVELRREAVEQAKNELALIPASEDKNWTAEVVQGIRNLDWPWVHKSLKVEGDIDVAGIVARVEEGRLKGDDLRLYLRAGAAGMADTRLLVRQILRRVVVTGSKGVAEGRVEVELIGGE